MTFRNQAQGPGSGKHHTPAPSREGATNMAASPRGPRTDRENPVLVATSTSPEPAIVRCLTFPGDPIPSLPIPAPSSKPKAKEGVGPGLAATAIGVLASLRSGRQAARVPMLTAITTDTA